MTKKTAKKKPATVAKKTATVKTTKKKPATPATAWTARAAKIAASRAANAKKGITVRQQRAAAAKARAKKGGKRPPAKRMTDTAASDARFLGVSVKTLKTGGKPWKGSKKTATADDPSVAANIAAQRAHRDAKVDAHLATVAPLTMTDGALPLEVK